MIHRIVVNHIALLITFLLLSKNGGVKSDQIVVELSKVPDRIQQQMRRENVSVPNRLERPSLNESIAHILLNPLDLNRKDVGRVKLIRDAWEENWRHYPERHEELGITELIKACAIEQQFDQLPVLFPRFLCGVASLYREFNKTRLPFTEVLFPRVTAAVKFLNDRRNYPCHAWNRTDVVALVPGRIYSGCVDDTNARNFSQFDSAFVMTHPFPDVSLKPCIESPKPKCELRSMLLQHKILYQQKDCCCDGEQCAMVIFSQTTSLTPLILKTIDLSQETLVPIPTPSTTRKPKQTRTRRTTKPTKIDMGPFFG